MNKLKSLDNKLRKTVRIASPVPNISGRAYPGFVDTKQETDYVLSEDELNTLIDSVNSNDSSMILVKQGGMGFYPKYDIVTGNYLYYWNDTAHIETIVSFTEKQLPEGWDFDKLSDTFNSENNLEKIDFFKQERPKKRSSYEY
jgi:hypothetical protein